MSYSLFILSTLIAILHCLCPWKAQAVQEVTSREGGRLFRGEEESKSLENDNEGEDDDKNKWRMRQDKS